MTAPVTPPAVELPKLTLSGSENVVTFDIRQIQRMLKKGEVLEIELLTKEKKSYAGALADFYALADKFCHVATISDDMALAQQCSPTTTSRGLQEWSSAISYLSGIALGVRSDSRAAASYAAFVRSNPGVVYLIEKGRAVFPMTVKDLQGLLNRTVRMSNALAIEFDGCLFPQKASGNQLSKVCRSSLPVPPLSIVHDKDKLVLSRQASRDASVYVQISTREGNVKKANPVANVPVNVQQLPDIPCGKMLAKDDAPLKEGEQCTTLYDGPRPDGPEKWREKVFELDARCRELLWKSLNMDWVSFNDKKYALRCGGPKNCREPESCTEDSCTVDEDNYIAISKAADPSNKFPGQPFINWEHPKANKNYLRFVDKNNSGKYELGDSILCCYPPEVYFQFGCKECKDKGSSSSSVSSSSSSSSSSSTTSTGSTSSTSSSVFSMSPSSESSSSSLSSDNPSSASSEYPSSEDPSSQYSSSSASSEYPSSEDPSSQYSSSSASDKIYACMCDGKDDTGRLVRAENRPPDTKAQCDAFCPPSQRDKDGWCTKTDGFGTTSKVRNCKWELTDPPLN